MVAKNSYAPSIKIPDRVRHRHCTTRVAMVFHELGAGVQEEFENQ